MTVVCIPFQQAKSKFLVRLLSQSYATFSCYFCNDYSSQRMMEEAYTFRNITFTDIPPSMPSVPMLWPLSAPVASPVASPSSIGPLECESGSFKVDVTMHFDEYADETSYKIIDTSTNAVVDEFQGTKELSKSTLNKASCLSSNKTYTLIVKDSYGDGMQGSAIQGSFELKVDGVVKGSGGAFKYFEVIGFGTPRKCTGNDKSFTILVQNDQYGAETSYVIHNLRTGRIVAKSRAFLSSAQNIEEICLPPDQYRFRIKDSKGDGMCCAYGIGFFAIFLNGNLVKKGGEFDYVENTIFSVY